MYKLIAIDLDDTLLNDEGVISEKNKAAIQRAEKAGVKVVIVSGRSYSSTKQYIKELALPNLTVSLNGAYIQDPMDDRLVDGFPIAQSVTLELIKDIEPFEVHINFYNGEKVICQDPSEQALFYSQMNRIEIDYVDSLAELSKTTQAGKLLMSDNQEKLKEIKDLLQKKYGDELNIVFSKPIFLEVTDKKASKGAALLKVAEMYGIEAPEVIAIGDSENDISMIRSAGLGIAVANAKEIIKNEADFVTFSNNESGVAYAINKFIFNESQEQEVN
ncbi:Cof-type HAD-IIB family hydrolase [Sinanaerobacter chloroacetimidivorans]|uniref:HAD family phosphatase n=1 Tax=Sinanaerobacter chloroacetimidivorans TaxID=2818044 RepID=A0A8J8B385_9FIRM|nr:Cof-type HAD-IIB family hydrolase [Sinanaerobacter chloroacetimidivorans]MBR0600608.1 HAD family phosphatase [Sinanaerobacter chloroacetimidivorans]